MSPIPKYYRRSLSLGGLRKRSGLRVGYDAGSGTVAWVEGADVDPLDVEISAESGFNLPLYLRVEAVPLFPTTYEFINTGEVVYHAASAPGFPIRVPERDDFLNERAKVMEVTLTTKKLDELGNYGARARSPSQKSVMGESAEDHARRLVEDGRLISSHPGVTWHWCHLIAFSMLPTHRAQTKRNLFCGTSAANGQMANIETAVRAWVYEMNRPLGLEVTCEYLVDSHLGLRLRYRLWDRKTGGSHSEYYDPLSPQHSEFDDLDAVFDRMCERLDGAG